MKRTIEARKSIDWQVKLKSLESQNPFNTLQQTLGKRSSSVIKGGYSAVTLRNIESKTTILPDLPGHPTEAINSIIDENREQQDDDMRAAQRLKLFNLKLGRNKAHGDSELISRIDRAYYGNNFKDLGIRSRVSISPPQYKNKYEFINEKSSDDEEINEK